MSNIKLFESKKIRSYWDEKEQQWYFSVIDVVEVLTDSANARDYWFKMKIRVKTEDGIELSTICRQLKLKAGDGKMRQTDVANAKILLRIIQSIPSPKAEPFKLWLAQVGSDRVDEIENPELATQRIRELYKLKGYPDDWIEKRMRSIAIREELTEEWKNRDIKNQKEYAILTAEISKATFGLTPSQYKKIKALKSQNLRDHMNDLELWFIANKIVAKQGGSVAGKARRDLETKTGRKIVSSENYLPEAKKNKQLKNGEK